MRDSYLTRLEIKFLSVGCGDGIVIHFIGNDGNYHNIILDGGTALGKVYEETLRKELINIVERGEKVDLWIITHIDDDHIGGILRLLKDDGVFRRVDISRTRFWYNYCSLDYVVSVNRSDLKSVRQGISLRDFLKANALLVDDVTTAPRPVDMFGAILTVVSPNSKKIRELNDKWMKKEEKIVLRKWARPKAAKKNDYGIKIEDFPLERFIEDESVENGSSIGFIFEHSDWKILFSADSHPSVIVGALKEMGYTSKEKLLLNLMQMPHHGSKGNTSQDLLDLIECKNYVISADGYNRHNLPNKETLARVIRNNASEVNFHITHENDRTKGIFDVDPVKAPAGLFFPNGGERALIFSL